MQPGDGKPRQLRGDARAPSVGAVGGQESDAAARGEAELHEYALDAPDQVGRALIGDRSTRPAEGGTRRIARQRPQRLLADCWKRVERIAHSLLPVRFVVFFLSWFLSRFVLGLRSCQCWRQR